MKTEGSILTEAQEAELRRMKAYFPSRIVWAALGPNGEFERGASHTRRIMNTYLKKAGWCVVTIS